MAGQAGLLRSRRRVAQQPPGAGQLGVERRVGHQAAPRAGVDVGRQRGGRRQVEGGGGAGAEAGVRRRLVHARRVRACGRVRVGARRWGERRVETGLPLPGRRLRAPVVAWELGEMRTVSAGDKITTQKI